MTKSARLANFGSFAKPFVKASVGVAPDLQPGNWVTVPGQTKKSRVAGYTAEGQAILVSPRGKGRHSRVSTDAFRLARSKPVTNVLTVAATQPDPLSSALEELLAQLF